VEAKKKYSLVSILDVFLVFLIVVTVSYIYIDIKNIRKTLIEMDKTKIYNIAKANEKILLSLASKKEFDQLKNQLKSLVEKNQDIKKVYFVYNDFKYEYPKSTPVKSNIEIKLKDDFDAYSMIKIYYDSNVMLNKFFEKYFMRFFVYLLVLFPLVLLMFFILRKKIKKLNILAKKVESVNFLKISSLPRIDDYYEIWNISQAINKLLLQVNKFYKNQRSIIKKLNNYKTHLESAQKLANMFSWEYDCNTQIFHITENIKDILYTHQEIKNIDEFLLYFDADERKQMIKKINRLCEDCSSVDLVHKLITENNKYKTFRTEIKCFKSETGSKVLLAASLDISEEIDKQKKIEYLAYHDTLTNLPNRTFLKENLQILMNIVQRNNKKLAVLYLDLDNFKMVNDNFGHESGDKLLIYIANVLKKVLRKSDLISRIGGDEFIIVLTDINSKEDVETILDKLTQELKKPFVLNENNFINPTFSIGVVIFPDDSTDMNELLQLADIAMYYSKKKGKNTYTFITEEIKNEIKEHYNISTMLKEALEKDDELVLFFQPKVDIVNDKIAGAESLIRWRHPTRGILSPFFFIPIAEKSDLIMQIDRYIIRKAFQTLNRWAKDEALKDLSIAINISAKEFKQKDFVDNIKKLLEEYKIDPDKLEIEITETLSMDDINYTIEILNKIKDLGIKIALDDFGTGYSSLNYLKKLPFDTLKIDQSFVRDLKNDKDGFVITQMIIEIAKVLNKKTVAEGVEDEELLYIIKLLGCDYVQGYYFSKPIDEEEFIKYVKNFDPNNL